MHFFVLIEIEIIEYTIIHSINPINPINVKTPMFIPWLIGDSGFPKHTAHGKIYLGIKVINIGMNLTRIDLRDYF